MSIDSPVLPPLADPGMPADGFGRALAAVHTGLDLLAEAPVWSLDDARVQARLSQALQARARLDESIARLVTQVDDRGLAGATGASSTRAHLVAAYRMSGGAAAGLLTQARAMTDRTDPTRQAWADGQISGEQAAVIGAAVDKLSASVPDGVVDRAQLDLVDRAQTLTHTQLQILTNHLVQVVDPDGADAALAAQLEADEARALAQTTFRGRRGADGTARLSATMPNLAYDILTTALEAIASPHRTQQPDTTAVTAPAGTQQTQLTYGQRMGRAFVELLEHLPTDALPRHAPPTPPSSSPSTQTRSPPVSGRRP